MLLIVLLTQSPLLYEDVFLLFYETYLFGVQKCRTLIN